MLRRIFGSCTFQWGDVEELIDLLDDLEILPKTLDALLHSVLGPVPDVHNTIWQIVTPDVMMERYSVPDSMFSTTIVHHVPHRVLSIVNGSFSGWMPLRKHGSTQAAFDYYTKETWSKTGNVSFYRTDTHKLITFTTADSQAARYDALLKLCA